MLSVNLQFYSFNSIVTLQLEGLRFPPFNLSLQLGMLIFLPKVVNHEDLHLIQHKIIHFSPTEKLTKNLIASNLNAYNLFCQSMNNVETIQVFFLISYMGGLFDIHLLLQTC